MHTIDTEHGPATLWWDETGDPGWVLRYHLEPDGSPDAIGRRHLDAPLAADDPDETPIDEALDFLAREGIGAGERLTTAAAAELAQVVPARWRSIVSEDRDRRRPDGHYDARTPWWWTTTVRRILAQRPGRGTRTDLRAGRA